MKPETKKYQIIYADPPWRYEHPAIGSKSKAIENHYPTMLLEDIKKLKDGTVALKRFGKWVDRDNPAIFLDTAFYKELK